MKSLFLAVLFVLGVIGLLRSDLSPWHLVTTAELEAIKADAAHTAEVAAEAAAAAQAKPTGSWMRDASYRTSLEKGTPLSLAPVKQR
ncbi:MAG: hypothetical protein WDN28_20255 [Chthoniobacter sp.]